MIAGVSIEIGSEAVVVVSSQPLRVLSSAVHLGGFADARALLNVHVGKNDPCLDPSGMIAAFAGHRHTDSTLTYIHLSGRDLAAKLASGMDHVHAWRVRTLASAGGPGEASR